MILSVAVTTTVVLVAWKSKVMEVNSSIKICKDASMVANVLVISHLCPTNFLELYIHDEPHFFPVIVKFWVGGGVV